MTIQTIALALHMHIIFRESSSRAQPLPRKRGGASPCFGSTPLLMGRGCGCSSDGLTSYEWGRRTPRGIPCCYNQGPTQRVVAKYDIYEIMYTWIHVAVTIVVSDFNPCNYHQANTHIYMYMCVTLHQVHVHCLCAGVDGRKWWGPGEKGPHREGKRGHRVSVNAPCKGVIASIHVHVQCMY